MSFDKVQTNVSSLGRIYAQLNTQLVDGSDTLSGWVIKVCICLTWFGDLTIWRVLVASASSFCVILCPDSPRHIIFKYLHKLKRSWSDKKILVKISSQSWDMYARIYLYLSMVECNKIPNAIKYFASIMFHIHMLFMDILFDWLGMWHGR